MQLGAIPHTRAVGSGMLMTSFIASPRQSGDFMSEKDVSAMMT